MDHAAELRQNVGRMFALPADADCREVDSKGESVGRVVLLPAGTEVRYIGTSHDLMGMWVFHSLDVLSGPEQGASVILRMLDGSDALPWV